MDYYTENDWKLFRSKIGAWQERYIDKLNKEYIELLNSDIAPSEKFWQLEKRIEKDKSRSGVMIEMKRSVFLSNVAALLADGVIDMSDLNGFSETLKEATQKLMKIPIYEDY